MKIKTVEPNGIGEEIGLSAGDKILRINEKKIRDIIDYQFYICETEILLEIQRKGEVAEYEIEKDYGEDLGLVFEDIRYRSCGSKCIFCFVDQNPKGMRKALYFRDEDFRLSFLHGSYFTLNNVGRADLDRIISQKLSPLYISVHALDPEVRAYIFGVRRDDRLLEKIDLLVNEGIELHTQIVLCPGINDDEILDDTISGLAKFFPGVKSAAIVPLGMTKYRAGLPKLEHVTGPLTRKMIIDIHRKQKKYLDNFGQRFVYLSDEWYLKGERRLPSLAHYGELFQLENGVGMTRQFLKDINRQKRVFSRPLMNRKKVNILTGIMASDILKQNLVPILEAAEGLSAKVTGIINSFYGPGVQVSGLLSGRDFLRVIEKDNSDLFLLPPNCLNINGLTLDDITVKDMRQKTGKKIVQYKGGLNEIRLALEAA